MSDVKKALREIAQRRFGQLLSRRSPVLMNAVERSNDLASVIHAWLHANRDLPPLMRLVALSVAMRNVHQAMARELMARAPAGETCGCTLCVEIRRGPDHALAAHMAILDANREMADAFALDVIDAAEQIEALDSVKPTPTPVPPRSN